jgi:hypothetical protein
LKDILITFFTKVPVRKAVNLLNWNSDEENMRLFHNVLTSLSSASTGNSMNKGQSGHGFPTVSHKCHHVLEDFEEGPYNSATHKPSAYSVMLMTPLVIWLPGSAKQHKTSD